MVAIVFCALGFKGSENAFSKCLFVMWFKIFALEGEDEGRRCSVSSRNLSSWAGNGCQLVFI